LELRDRTEQSFFRIAAGLNFHGHERRLNCDLSSSASEGIAIHRVQRLSWATSAGLLAFGLLVARTLVRCDGDVTLILSHPARAMARKYSDESELDGVAKLLHDFI